MFQTQECIIKTEVSSVDNFNKDDFIASRLQFVSAFINTFNCFKLPDLILDIIKSIPVNAFDFLACIILIYSFAICLAFSISEIT
jgi:hypothetical protein